MLLTKHKQGEPLKLSNDTLNAFLDEWLKTRLDLKQSSRDHYERALGYYVRPKLGKLLLTKIEANDVQTLCTDLADGGLSAGTLSFVHTLLKSAFKLAVKRRKIVFNPIDRVTASRRSKLNWPPSRRANQRCGQERGTSPASSSPRMAQ